MNRTTRRSLARLGLSAGFLAVLAACSTTGTISANELNAILAGAQNIYTLVNEALPALKPLIGSNDWANVQTADTALGTVITQLQAAQQAGSVSSATAVSAVQAFEAALNAIVSVAASIPIIPPPYSAYLEAAAMALPAIEAILGLVIASNTALAATVSAKKMSLPAPKH
jgi:hypothetical protein